METVYVRSSVENRVSRVVRSEERRTLAEEADLARWVGQMRTVWSGARLTGTEARWAETFRGLIGA